MYLYQSILNGLKNKNPFKKSVLFDYNKYRLEESDTNRKSCKWFLSYFIECEQIIWANRIVLTNSIDLKIEIADK